MGIIMVGNKDQVQGRTVSSSEDKAGNTLDLQKMFEEFESTGTVQSNIPNPHAAGDAALLAWLKSGYIED